MSGPKLSPRLRRSILGLAVAALACCTPVPAVNRGEKPSDQGAAAESHDGGSDAAERDEDTASRVATATAAEACDQPGKRLCSTNDARVPVRCEASRWAAEAPCDESDRCETEEGARTGTCVPIATQCLMHAPGEAFCDGDLIRTCADLVLTKGQPCEEGRRCVDASGIARCVCAEGTIDDGSGLGCQVPTSCARDNGGCDALTQCSVRSGARVCSECPPEYEGDGATGCYAQLTALTVDAGALTPQFSPDVHSYRVRLPLLRQSVQVMASTETNVRVTFNDVEHAPPESAWQSPLLALGEYRVEISLTTREGRESSYELLIERAGVQEAYLKAGDPDRNDDFGSSVAIWGDTIAVGALAEDSSSTQGDQVNNLAENSGAVRVFVRDGDSWMEQAYLKADPPLANDYFGTSLALREDMLVVGATGASPVASSTPHGGSVHVFVREAGRWSLRSKLVAANSGVQDMFGQSVALDERRLIVGAPLEGSRETFSGAVYVFERTDQGFGAPRTIKATAPRASGLFGLSVALTEETLVVGSPQYNVLRPSSTGSGTVYIFDCADWNQLQELTAPVSVEDGATFGWSVDISGDTIAVGAPRSRISNEGQGPGEAFVYERSTGGAWSMVHAFRAPTPRVSDWFGFSVKLSGASTLLVGSAGDASGASGLMGESNDAANVDSGAVLVYGRDRDQWLNTAYIKPKHPGTPDYFGSAIAVHDGTLVATSPGEASDAAGVNGDQTSNASPSAGAAYVFR